ncbi:MAG: prepilin-type N-terminal cleavage/methylation domain-containing protein [Candidatus Gastranaerophilales bacterium]|nr:prepilin-type N-terminal cleavage/methylation domain-containing protein [Candidatus Gastranaerophilales bacterium]
MNQQIALKKYSAFTLAEVLITLLIIGVISSIVIPSIVQDTQNSELKIAWKKTYSDLDLATRKIMADNAGNVKSVFTNSNSLKNEYKNHLSYVKDCNEGLSRGNCWHASGVPKPFAGTSVPYADIYGNYPSLILNNGALVSIHLASSSCTNGQAGITVCGWYFIDINGFKGPNIQGKDIFAVYLLGNTLRVMGAPNDPYPPSTTCTSSSTGPGSGLGCSALYLYQ